MLLIKYFLLFEQSIRIWQYIYIYIGYIISTFIFQAPTVPFSNFGNNFEIRKRKIVKKYRKYLLANKIIKKKSQKILIRIKNNKLINTIISID